MFLYIRKKNPISKASDIREDVCYDVSVWYLSVDDYAIDRITLVTYAFFIQFWFLIYHLTLNIT